MKLQVIDKYLKVTRNIINWQLLTLNVPTMMLLYAPPRTQLNA